MTPIVIGVAGGSGSGKTTVAARIVESPGGERVTVIEQYLGSVKPTHLKSVESGTRYADIVIPRGDTTP